MDSVSVPDPPCGTRACAEVVRQLAAALGSRDVIGMAKGLLMARERCSPDDAFDVLRRASQRENVKVVTVATRLVAAAAPSRASAVPEPAF